jgi:anti-anti-sigma factor
MSVSRAGQTLVVTLIGELELGTAELASAYLAELVHSGDDIVVDLRGVEYLDPDGLGALLDAREDAAHRGATLTLRSPSRDVARILACSGAAELLWIEW